MHNDRIFLCEFETREVELVTADVFVEIELEASKSLLLNAKHHDNVGALDGGFHVALNADTGRKLRGRVGEQDFGAAEGDVGTELGEQVGVTAGDSRMEDVADG